MEICNDLESCLHSRGIGVDHIPRPTVAYSPRYFKGIGAAEGPLRHLVGAPNGPRATNVDAANRLWLRPCTILIVFSCGEPYLGTILERANMARRHFAIRVF